MRHRPPDTEPSLPASRCRATAAKIERTGRRAHADSEQRKSDSRGSIASSTMRWSRQERPPQAPRPGVRATAAGGRDRCSSPAGRKHRPCFFYRHCSAGAPPVGNARAYTFGDPTAGAADRRDLRRLEACFGRVRTRLAPQSGFRGPRSGRGIVLGGPGCTDSGLGCGRRRSTARTRPLAAAESSNVLLLTLAARPAPGGTLDNARYNTGRHAT